MVAEHETLRAFQHFEFLLADAVIAVSVALK